MAKRIDFLKNTPDPALEAAEKILAKKEAEELEKMKVLHERQENISRSYRASINTGHLGSIWGAEVIISPTTLDNRITFNINHPSTEMFVDSMVEQANRRAREQQLLNSIDGVQNNSLSLDALDALDPAVRESYLEHLRQSILPGQSPRNIMISG